MAEVWANSVACRPRRCCHCFAAIATGRIQWHVIPEPRITLQGAATWWIHCHDSRSTCHIAGYSHLAKSMSWLWHIARCNNSIRHIENCFSPNSFGYFNAVWALTSGSFRIVSDILVFFLSSRGWNKRCLLLRYAADAEIIADIREWVRVSAGQCSSTQYSWDNWALTSRDAGLFHRNSVHWTVQILTRWITKSGLQCSSTSSKQRFEMLANCCSVCWMFGAALNKTSSTHPLTSGMCDSKHACYRETDILNTYCKFIYIDIRTSR